MDKLNLRRTMDEGRRTKRILTGFFVPLLSSVVLLSSSLVPLPSSLVYAEIPRLINYQGRLTDKENKPVPDSAYSVTFRIFDAQTGGALLWEEVHPSLIIQKGIFSVLLGSVKNLDLAFDKPYFLEIKVGDDEPLAPRQQIASAGYAIRAEKAEKINASGVAGMLTAGNLPKGSIVQIVHTQHREPKTLIGVKPLPYDNTPPLWNEGAEYPELATTISPTDTNNKLLIEVEVTGVTQVGNGGSIMLALFRDPTENSASIATALESQQSTNLGSDAGASTHKIRLRYSVSAETTALTVFKIRLSAGGTTNAMVNQFYFGNTNFGNTLVSSLTITEIKG